MRSQLWLLIVVVAGVAGISGGYLWGRQQQHSSLPAGDKSAQSSTSANPSQKKILYWYDPMVPAQKFDKPGKSPFMDMQLVPKYADDMAKGAKGAEGAEDAGAGDSAEAGVHVSGAIRQALAVKLVPVASGRIEQQRLIPALTAYNDQQIALVQARSRGFVEKVYPLAAGEIIRAGAPIADILYPEWAAAQLEMLALKKTPEADSALIQASRQKLRLLGMPEMLIEQVWQKQQPIERVPVVAPITGVVTELMIRQGMTVEMGMSLVRIAGINPLWVEADVPLNIAAGWRKGQSMAVILQSETAPRTATIREILPQINESSRTVRLRASLPNPDFRLKVGALAQWSMQSQSEAGLIIPVAALIRTGMRNLVIVAKDNRYLPKEVEVGEEGGGKVLIRKGLSEGEQVVESGQFLIDSEASLNGILARLPPVTPSGEEKTPSAPADERAASALGVGVIEKIEGSNLIVSHQPIAAIGWPAMTMPIEVADKKLLRGLKAGDRIDFTLAPHPQMAGYWIVAVDIKH